MNERYTNASVGRRTYGNLQPGHALSAEMKDKLRSLPGAPGVYIMKDAGGGILYVGKSKHLKNRVNSYFHQSKSHAPKIQKLVRHVKELEIIRTDTEFEAFLLECSLIHKFKPMYNRKMKNPASYSYIIIPASAGLRHFETSPHPQPAPGDDVFGPYPASQTAVEKAVQTILECLKIGCSPAAAANAPCLNHSIGLCLGMCMGGDQLKKYHWQMNRLIGLLKGTDRSLCEELEGNMAEAAERFDFESAAKYRDVLQSIRFLEQKEKVIGFAGNNPNVVLYEQLDMNTIKLFFVKRHTVLFSRVYPIGSDREKEQLITEAEVLARACFKQDASAYASEISRDEIDEAQIIYSYVQSHPGQTALIPDAWLDSRSSAELSDALRALFLDNQTEDEQHKI
ncbi:MULTISPECIES: GIY-YIG nuclease family protein [Paenibacillus]|uniref:Excinuclease ABC subunit C n=1 Tax=Paenibacillus albilobatus TaxID=2716884 RepID=A0A920C9G0_9BACL|nr:MULTISPECIES: GIY-YIG nuclease family protein [Paenibacillus]GIO31060.1 excinuclease ABC subunit C [Paenibacillus albilobatus]